MYEDLHGDGEKNKKYEKASTAVFDENIYYSYGVIYHLQTTKQKSSVHFDVVRSIIVLYSSTAGTFAVLCNYI